MSTTVDILCLTPRRMMSTTVDILCLTLRRIMSTTVDILCFNPWKTNVDYSENVVFLTHRSLMSTTIYILLFNNLKWCPYLSQSIKKCLESFFKLTWVGICMVNYQNRLNDLPKNIVFVSFATNFNIKITFLKLF